LVIFTADTTDTTSTSDDSAFSTIPGPRPKPGKLESFQKYDRVLWRDFRPRRESLGPESKRQLNSPSNKQLAINEDSPKTRPQLSEIFLDEVDWKKGLHDVRSGNWYCLPGSLPTVSALTYCRTVEEARAVWENQDPEDARHAWAPVMLALLNDDLLQACRFLQASFPSLNPPLYALQDSIAFIYSSLKLSPATEKEDVWNALADTIIFLLRNHPDARTMFERMDFHALQKRLCPKKLVELYRGLRAVQVQLTTYTLMHIASSLSRDPSLKRMSLEVMAEGLARTRDEPAKTQELLRKRWSSVFTTILTYSRHSMVDAEVVSPEEIWHFAIEHGIKPNAIQLTALVQGFCATGQVEAAWQAFDMYSERGMPVDLKLLTALLQGSKLLGSVSYVIRAITLIAETGNVDGRVGNSILHLVLSMALRDPNGPITSFPLMLRIYSRLFIREPLEAIIPKNLLGDVVREDNVLEDMVLDPAFTSTLDLLCPPGKAPSLEPTIATLEIMVLSWICSLRKEYKSPAIIAFYGHYRKLLQDWHPIATKIVKKRNTVIHDMIVKALTTSSGHLRLALDVVSDMLRDAPAHSKSVPTSDSSIISLPKRNSVSASGSSIIPLPTTSLSSSSSSSTNPDSDSSTSTKLYKKKVPCPGPVHPVPSAWTWNILLDSWMRFNRQDTAGRIVNLMRQHGVEPTIVTWNTILSRAAGVGNIKLAVKSARKIRESGLEPNERTILAFSKLVEKEEFLREFGNVLPEKPGEWGEDTVGVGVGKGLEEVVGFGERERVKSSPSREKSESQEKSDPWERMEKSYTPQKSDSQGKSNSWARSDTWTKRDLWETSHAMARSERAPLRK